MKKTGIILLSVFYFVVASGFALNLHYCAGKIKGFSFLINNEQGCCGSKKKSKGCCKEKTVVYKVSNDHHSIAKASLPNISLKHLAVVQSYIVWDLSKLVVAHYAVPDSNAPPFDDPDPVYLLNRNFRI